MLEDGRCRQATMNGHEARLTPPCYQMTDKEEILLCGVCRRIRWKNQHHHPHLRDKAFVFVFQWGRENQGHMKQPYQLGYPYGSGIQDTKCERTRVEG